VNLELAGSTALVAGASRGIGLAIARALHAEGCSVAFAARQRADLDAATADLRERFSVHTADVTDAEAATNLAADVAKKWGRLDIVICNAGSGASVPPGSETPAEWQRVINVNLFAATHVIAAVRAPMKAAGGGAIVCVSSICGLAALGAPVTYSAAKAALNATVRGLARPLAADGIRINAVAPGNILFAGGTWERKLRENETAVRDMLSREVAQARLGTPQEIADLVLFLASARASFITGAIYVADGGQLRA
jgi:3-oxoacyl-[acyl-carrier protein] reductase